MAKRFLDVLGEILTAVAEAAEEDRKRSLAMELVNRNTQYLDQQAKDIVTELQSSCSSVYYIKRRIEAMRLTDDQVTYLKRRLIAEAAPCSDYYCKMQLDHLLRTI